jgi:hypothetical protein
MRGDRRTDVWSLARAPVSSDARGDGYSARATFDALALAAVQEVELAEVQHRVAARAGLESNSSKILRAGKRATLIRPGRRGCRGCRPRSSAARRRTARRFTVRCGRDRRAWAALAPALMPRALGTGARAPTRGGSGDQPVVGGERPGLHGRFPNAAALDALRPRAAGVLELRNHPCRRTDQNGD